MSEVKFDITFIIVPQAHWLYDRAMLWAYPVVFKDFNVKCYYYKIFVVVMVITSCTL